MCDFESEKWGENLCSKNLIRLNIFITDGAQKMTAWNLNISFRLNTENTILLIYICEIEIILNDIFLL